MENVKILYDGNNFFSFLLVLVAILGIFILIGNAIKTYRDIKKPKEEKDLDLKTRVKKLEDIIYRHNSEIEAIRETNRIQCQAVKALLNHAIHDGNTDEMSKAASALDDYLTGRI